MEEKFVKWGFKNQKSSGVTIRDILETIEKNLSDTETRPVIHLGHGDPSSYPSFHTTAVAEEAIIGAVNSVQFNGYAPASGLHSARRSVAEYLSQNLPYKLSLHDVYLTAGANHAIEIVLTTLARPGANILLPTPGYPLYEARAAFSNLEVRHFDLLPENAWEVDLDSVEVLSDDNTIAMVVINPGNPCGNVYTYEHMQKIAETAKRLGILVIADEVYSHIFFGCNPFVPMGVFGSVCPVLTLGTVSKRWILPGWRLGWIAFNDPNDILKKSGIPECIQNYVSITADPATVIQGAIPQLLAKSTEDFFSKIVDLLRKTGDTCYDRTNKIHSLTCPQKPEGAMFTMVKINIALLEDIKDDMDFCIKLAKEESVILIPGIAVGLKNWLRMSFSVEHASLEDGLGRIKAFCLRHSKKQ